MKDNYVFPRMTSLGGQAPGMELRDWFAGMALQGYLATNDSDLRSDSVSQKAYEYADAMLAARSGQA
jgi:hypothetical protein